MFERFFKKELSQQEREGLEAEIKKIEERIDNLRRMKEEMKHEQCTGQRPNGTEIDDEELDMLRRSPDVINMGREINELEQKKEALKKKLE